MFNLYLEGYVMNTAEVAKLLGVSVSTVQRWVKQLELPMGRNDRGHYYFKEEDIQLLQNIQEQLQNGAILADIAPVTAKKSPRKGAIRSVGNDQTVEYLLSKVKEIEINLQAKADSVASYQLLQHRREIEELQNQIIALNQKCELLQEELNALKPVPSAEKPYVLDEGKVKRKKKNFVSSLFGF
ncbi:MerR family transcriptional regulator [Neobacillus sp. OS1-32]|uniref:MerR family transcriptional regulator n=1 Tax=Neobacillus sp. OS1-32 TaxID=3070682 RepID=UPI0027DF56F1|nr:MerR family transcriptional regulator [Neobacillus sp. OS1-32]WML31054.1 MerR family transcriptional regulator [Neobacillus sp. OS1-32]